MAQTECPDLDNLAKPATARSSLQYYYAVTVKPNSKLEQNDKDILERVVGEQFEGFRLDDRKYELDSLGILHIHFTLVSSFKIKSYYRFFKKGWMIHLSFIKDKIALCRWKHYLTKGDPDDQVLVMAKARTTYLFQ